MPTRALFIVNPTARFGRCLAEWRTWAPRFQDHGVVADTVLTHHPGEAIEIASAAAGRHEAVVAVGGDGTVFETVSGLLQAGPSPTALGILPLGTGNDAARAAGFKSPADALEALQRGRSRAVDVLRLRCQIDGSTQTRHAMLFAAVGIVGDSLELTTPTVRRFFGARLAYPVGVARALWRNRAPELRIAWDGGSRRGRFLFVAASNTETAGGGMRLAPGARIDDGLLNLNLIGALPPWAALPQLGRLCRGTHISHPQVTYTTGRFLALEADPPAVVAADGDIIGLTPAHIEVAPGALRLLA